MGCVGLGIASLEYNIKASTLLKTNIPFQQLKEQLQVKFRRN